MTEIEGTSKSTRRKFLVRELPTLAAIVSLASESADAGNASLFSPREVNMNDINKLINYHKSRMKSGIHTATVIFLLIQP